MLEELGYKQEPVVVLEDSRSLTDLVKRGKVPTGATKHTASKYYYATDLLKKRVVTTRRCPTKLMTADIPTKPLSGRKLKEVSIGLRSELEQSSELSDEVYARLYKFSSDRAYRGPFDQQVSSLVAVTIERIVSHY